KLALDPKALSVLLHFCPFADRKHIVGGAEEPATVLQEHWRQLATLLPLGESFGESAALDHVAIGIDIPEHGAIALQRAGFVVSLVELDLAKADVATFQRHYLVLRRRFLRPRLP